MAALDRGYRTEGVVLKRVNFGEADKIVTIYSRHYGKLSCLAKGVRRLTSRKRGALEIFNRTSFFAVRGRGLDILTEVEPIEVFSGRNLKRIAAAYEVCEMVDQLTVENSQEEEIYELLLAALNQISKAEEKSFPFLVNEFGQQLLRLTGFWPKDKAFPASFSVSTFIEQIIERDLKSRKISSKL